MAKKYKVTLVGKKTYRVGRYAFLKNRPVLLSDEQAEEFRGDSRFRVVDNVPPKPKRQVVDKNQYEEEEVEEEEVEEEEEPEEEEEEVEEEEVKVKPKQKKRKKKKTRSKLRKKVRREADGEG